MNWLHIIVAAVAAFAVGFFWFGKPLFGTAWMKASGMTEEKAKEGNMGATFGISFVLAIITSMCIAFIVGDKGATDGLLLGMGAGAGIAATQIGTHFLFEQKSLTHFLINGGYSIVTLGIMGLIHGAWH